MNYDINAVQIAMADSFSTIINRGAVNNEGSIIKRYLSEKKMIAAVMEGNYRQAVAVYKEMSTSDDDLSDMRARIPNDAERLRRNLAWLLNSELRISILLSRVPVTYVHIIASHFGMLVENAPIEMVMSDRLVDNMLNVYCYAVRKFNCNPQSEMVEKITNYILSNLQSDISLNQISQEFCYSPSYINRLLKRETGFTAVQYIKSQRIALAKMLLRMEDISIPDVATMVGYADYNYFSRVFKQLEGVSPLQYRKQLEPEDKENWSVFG